ncbi:MAG: RNA polymerase sigma factor [Pseudomonadota bacterium]
MRGADGQPDPHLDWLRRVKTDPDAFEALYRAYYPRLSDFLLRILDDSQAAEETVNDTMMVVWEKADSFREESRVSTWIFGIAYRKALKRFRSRQRVSTREIAGDIDLGTFADPHDVIAKTMNDEVLFSAVAKLPAAQKAVVHLALRFGYSYREISEILDCPVNTVKTRMFHARDKLRGHLDRALGQG